MQVADLVEGYPVLHHMAEAGSWPSIQERGLLSTTALLDLFEISGKERHAIECERRPRSVTISHSEHGEAVIRDQIPLNPTILARSLIDLSSDEWCALLNKRVFFWVSEDRLLRLLNAKAYRGSQHDVLTVDTASLVRAHEDHVTLAHLNTGTTLFRAPARGTETFRRISDYERRAVVELAVDYSVPDIADHTLRVESRKGPKVVSVVWERGAA